MLQHLFSPFSSDFLKKQLAPVSHHIESTKIALEKLSSHPDMMYCVGGVSVQLVTLGLALYNHPISQTSAALLASGTILHCMHKGYHVIAGPSVK